MKVTVDPEFVKQADQLMQGFTIIPPEDMAKAISDLEATPDEALKTTDELVRNLR
jgi:hypothetical protein